ncbi:MULTISPECIES: DoxX family protein [Micrococcaceae]|uniref:DoxX family protein n=1 Tax=unclassified Kocuria TaxID=2649579 RepID=UPI001011D846|nr:MULTISPECIES: hypothetical protein [unclassified Kocuria]
MTTYQQRKSARRSALLHGAFLATAGTLHFLRPTVFEGLVPPRLPGSARTWTLGSGVVELGVSALLLIPHTRRVGGQAATALYLGVWPGNFKMAWDYRHEEPARKVRAFGRLPLQLPLITSALKIARHAR